MLPAKPGGLPLGFAEYASRSLNFRCRRGARLIRGRLFRRACLQKLTQASVTRSLAMLISITSVLPDSRLSVIARRHNANSTTEALPAEHTHRCCS